MFSDQRRIIMASAIGTSITGYASMHRFALTQGKSMRYEPPEISFHLGETPPQESQGGGEPTVVRRRERV
jgi:hypothetical protein